MSARDILAALSVAIVWGLKFIAIKVGVGETSPLMLAALRFLFAAVPMVFFLAPPKAPAWAGCALRAPDRGRPVRPAVHRHPSGLPGRARVAGHPWRRCSSPSCSLGSSWASGRAAPRSSAPRSALPAWRSSARNASRARASGRSCSSFWRLCSGARATCWRRASARSTCSLSSSGRAWPRRCRCSRCRLRSRGQAASSRSPIRAGSSSSACWCISYGGTLFGYGVWARLLAHHSAATVAPFALLVPVVGMIAGALLFGETLSAVELVGGALVMAGLALNVFGDWRCGACPPRRPSHKGVEPILGGPEPRGRKVAALHGLRRWNVSWPLIGKVAMALASRWPS